MMFLRSIFSCWIVRDFQTGALLLPAGRFKGVMGLLLAVGHEGCEGVDGEGWSSSMLKISSTAVILASGLRSGVAPGDRGMICGLFVASTTGDRGFHFVGARTRGTGMSWRSNQSRCFAMSSSTRMPLRGMNDLSPCFPAMMPERSRSTSSSMSSSRPDSSIVSMHDTM